MPRALPDKSGVLEAIRKIAQDLGHPPARSEFIAKSGMTEYQVLQHFPSWREAVRMAGFDHNPTNVKLDDRTLLEDWGELVRKNKQILTRLQYRREGTFSPGVFDRHFGSWSAISDAFQNFAKDKSEWLDVLALLPVRPMKKDSNLTRPVSREEQADSQVVCSPTFSQGQRSKLQGLPTYGNPVDFRGLRHEPVNELGSRLLVWNGST